MPHTILILGGSGKVALHLTKQLISRGDTVHSLIRNPSQAAHLKSLGANPVVQSLEDSSVSSLTATFTRLKPTAIVWSAGAGGGNPDRTDAVDRDAAIRCMDAAAEAVSSGGTKRYIVVSAVDVRDRENKPVPDWYNEDDKSRSERVWGFIGRYMKAKLAADTALVTGNDRRKLEYTIVRPSGLSDDPGTGMIAAGKVGVARTIKREDVASTVMACIDNEKTVGLAFDVVGGDDKEDALPVEEAIRKVADGHIDTFDGFY
jgi:nucleoside-diphosphate-sugar epimerase